MNKLWKTLERPKKAAFQAVFRPSNFPFRFGVLFAFYKNAAFSFLVASDVIAFLFFVWISTT